MDNQHRLVKGYRDLTQQEIDAMNSIKLAEQDIGQLFQQVRAIPGVDQRVMAIAKTQLQQAFSWFVRGVAQPLDVYELALPEETWLTRLEAERNRTVSDLEKLTAFLEGPVAQTIPAEVLDDMRAQKKVMTELAFILSKRYDEATR